MKNIAIILAAGSGSRFGDKIPKQFYSFAGKTVLEHSVDAYEKNENIDEIVIVVNCLYITKVKEFVKNNNWTKIKHILIGGNERYESSFVAIRTYSTENECNMIFHDAVRPLVSQEIINNTIKALNVFNAVDTAIQITDTIVKANNNIIEEIPERKYFYKSQTPQAFKLSTIKKAYKIFLDDNNFQATDDCGIIKKYLPKENIFIVEGQESNIKLTFKEDIFLMELLFEKMQKIKTNLKTINNQ
ncbi:MAG: 2-C-methyl-D-erythritol 4-phosphate cytidylyltransferase [Bacteroidales bacterium]|jgi:2-C-methyl-D-erythritol 4-phosphate cytidylyltransferase|nr:2-C-methyl-D-erythritol 4-phosphate cytidylyltransferase [Bacteroidales bacterium]